MRLAALVVGSVAALAMVIVGCTTVTQGTARVDAADAPVYRASVSSSIAASAATSSARESERQQSLTTRAIHNVCEDLSASSADAVSTVNSYVDAFNENAGDVGAKARPAIDSLRRSADLVDGGITEALKPRLRDALSGWIGAARDVAGAIERDAGPAEFNAAVNTLNDSRTNALNLCDNSY